MSTHSPQHCGRSNLLHGNERESVKRFLVTCFLRRSGWRRVAQSGWIMAGFYRCRSPYFTRLAALLLERNDRRRAAAARPAEGSSPSPPDLSLSAENCCHVQGVFWSHCTFTSPVEFFAVRNLQAISQQRIGVACQGLMAPNYLKCVG